MSTLYVIGEDALCCALGSKLAVTVLGWQLAQPAVNTNGVTKLKPSIPRYQSLSKIHPVLCIADTDGCCALDLLREWLPNNGPEDFMLRFAVSEAESWILADSETLAEYFRVPHEKVPRKPDDEDDAKLALLKLARRSRQKVIRTEVVSSVNPNKPGSGYNVHLGDYIANHWRPIEAAERSPSLLRAIRRLEKLRSRN